MERQVRARNQCCGRGEQTAKPGVQSTHKLLIAQSKHHQENYKRTTQGQLTQMSSGEFDWSCAYSPVLLFVLAGGEDKDCLQRLTVDAVECLDA